MYASNENEDWVYLHETPPTNTILQSTVNLIHHECSSSSSFSSSSSNLSESDRSDSFSSTSSNELEYAQNDDIILNTDVLFSSTNDSHDDLEQENHFLETTNIEDSLLFSHNNITQTNLLLSQQLISTSTLIEKEILPSEISTDTPVEINENDILNTGFDLNKTLSLTNNSESLSLPNDLRHRTDVNAQQTDLYNSKIIQSTSISHDVKPQKRFEWHENKNNTLISFTCIIVILILPLILGQIITRWDQPGMNKIMKELIKTNQHLNEIKDIPIGNIEEKLTKQLEEKLQNMINQQLTWLDHERYNFILQIRELREKLNIIKQNLTNTIQQLTNENQQLKEQIKSLEGRLGIAEEQSPKDTKTCLEGINCTKSSTSILDKLVTNIFKQTVPITAYTPVNLSNIFEHLSASVNNIVNHRLKENKQKLTDFSGSSVAEQVQTTFRRSVENLSSSFRKAKLTYATWLKSRTTQTRMKNEKEKQQTPKKYPWRWIFQRDYNWGRMRQQKSNKEHICYSKYYFPMNKICSMKNWMVKFFRS